MEGVALAVVAVAVGPPEEAEDVAEVEVVVVEGEGDGCPSLRNGVPSESQGMGTYEPYCGDGLGTHRTVSLGWRFIAQGFTLTACTG